jgi:hypothetical protein
MSNADPCSHDHLALSQQAFDSVSGCLFHEEHNAVGGEDLNAHVPHYRWPGVFLPRPFLFGRKDRVSEDPSLFPPPISQSLEVISQLEINRMRIEVGLPGQVGLRISPDIVIDQRHRNNEGHIPGRDALVQT